VADAEAFANAHNLGEHAPLFGRAALVARDGRDFMSVPELSEEERNALEYERDHKWHGPKMLWWSIGLCAVGAATQGEQIVSHLVRNNADDRMGSDWFKWCQLVFPGRIWNCWRRSR